MIACKNIQFKNKMNFFKLSMLAIFCSLLVGFMPTFLKFAFSDARALQASVSESRISSLPSKPKITDTVRVLIAEKVKIPVYIADNEIKRIKGLSGKKSIPNDYGMFFIFDRSDYQNIWMKDMLFSIDIIWIDENNKIVHIEKNISPSSYPRIFTAPTKALFVLELNSGMSSVYDLKVGGLIFLRS